MIDYYAQEPQGQKPNKIPKAINTNVVLYLGELPKDLDQYELHQFIMEQGKFNIESLTVKPTKENKSFAYVKFKSKVEMERAKEALHLKSIRNYIIKAEPFRQKDSFKDDKKSGEKTNTNLFVKNLPFSTTPKELFDLFSKFGNIISIKLKQNKNGESLGYGYVKFEKNDSAQEAIKALNEVEHQGKKLYVSEFSSKTERSSENENKFPLVLIKKIPENITEEKKLYEIFSKFGQIQICGFANFNTEEKLNQNNIEKNIDITPEESSKVGVVLFMNKEDASDSVEALNDTPYEGSEIKFNLCLSSINEEIIKKLWKAKQENYKKKYQGCNLVVKNIPKEITERNLFEICKKFGDIAVARIATEGKMKILKDDLGNVLDKEFVYESKGYGFVLFKNAEDASIAKDALNQKVEFKNMILSLIVEFYDYNKAEKDKEMKELGIYDKMKNEKKTKFDKNNQEKKLKNKKPYNKNFPQTIINPDGTQSVTNNRPMKNEMVKHKNFNNSMPMQMNQMQLHMSQMHQMHQMQVNQHIPMGQHNQMINNYNNVFQNNQPMNQPNMFNQQMNSQVNQITSQMNQMKPFGAPQKAQEDIDFLNDVQKILKDSSLEDKTESLGEVMFYYLLRFIAKFNLNRSNGKFDDPTLCSKLTGMFLSIEEKDLMDILTNTEVLTITINDVVGVI
jgi:RNA recognition motif-containing protein